MLNLCPICCNQILGELCSFHARNTVEYTWAKSNKIWNDILMRGAPFPKRIEIGLEDLTT